MIGILLAAVSPFSTVGSTSMPPELRAMMAAVLRCAAAKDLRCLSRYAEHPSALRADFPNGKHGWNPSLEESGLSDVGVSLYSAAVDRKKIVYRAYRVSRDHYDIVFYRAGTLPANATWEQAGKLTSVHCEFEKTRSGWRLTDTVCGYVDTD